MQGETTMNQLDHLVIAAPDLDAAKQRFQDATGVAPVDGGRHVGLGTRNALVSFGSGRYLEIIAPDPEQNLDGGFGAALADLDSELPLHWAVRVAALQPIADHATNVGLDAGLIRRTSRAQPDGTMLEWQLMGVSGHDLGGFVPFYIDWLECPHPSDTAPVVGELTLFEVTLPEGSSAKRLLDPAPAGVALVNGEPRLRVRFESPKGIIEYESRDLQGFSM